MSAAPGALPEDPVVLMHSILKRIATGPELSKDISREEACAGMRAILDARVDPVQAGIFLIALRMKRETDDENRGMLEAIREATHRATAAVDDVVDIADPYDGFVRTLPASPFLPALLAACGIPAVSHGVESMGPKFGLTHRQVLRACGVAVDLDAEGAAARLGDPAIGWAYVDQAAFCPKLHALTGLRGLIVKRPAITTTEVLAGPVRGRLRTHLVTGFVHKPYPRIYAMLARHAGFDSALIVRGVEGGVIPSLCQTGRVFRYQDGGEEQGEDFKPAELGFHHTVRAARMPGDAAGAEGEGEGVAAPDLAAAAKAAVECGLEALGGRPGPTHDALAYGAALCLWHLGRCATMPEAVGVAREVLRSGKALARLGRV
jgi:anthranilate phosphoribosyltransferase